MNTDTSFETIPCPDLDASVDYYTKQLGYRLDMMVPADSPTAALVSKDGETVKLDLSPCFSRPNRDEGPTEVGTQNGWVTGRAGMGYRDLIPGRLDGEVIASHIRLTKGGPVADYVHYHKVRFQMIYCLKGRIKVVYEDQGPPFWLETGDCVLQPPEIRHRVLECTTGAEVIEVGMPAVHETWVEHEIKLPTSRIFADREFGGQRFLRHIESEAEWKASEPDGVEERDTGIYVATGGFADVRVARTVSNGSEILQVSVPVQSSSFRTSLKIDLLNTKTQSEDTEYHTL